jgi:hypothetical protein
MLGITAPAVTVSAADATITVIAEEIAAQTLPGGVLGLGTSAGPRALRA